MPTIRIRRAAACCASALSVLALGAVSASAATAPTADYGYAVTGGTYTSVTGSWNVPMVTCTPQPTTNNVLAGLDGYSSPAVARAGVRMNCLHGVDTYHGWYQLSPSAAVVLKFTVKPGDNVVVSVRASKSGRFTFSINDTTQKWAAGAVAFRSGAVLSSAEAVVQDPICTGFTAVRFKNVVVNGSSLGSLKPVKVAGSCSITVSPVSGSSFSVSQPS